MPRTLICLRSLLALGLLSLAACGGGGGSNDVNDPDPDPQPVSVDLALDAANTGFTSSTGGLSPGATLSVGDVGGTNATVRGFLSFSLGAIPPGATIQLATLRCSQVQVVGVPYTALGAVQVDHMDLGGALDATDHGAAALTANVATLSTTPTLELKTAVVTAQVVADLGAGRTVSAFRLLFPTATNNDGAPDTAILRQQNPGEELVLRVTYLP